MRPGIHHVVRSADGTVRHQGFTLIELMLVTALIVTVSGIAIPMYLESVKSARIVRACSEIRSIGSTIDVMCLEADTCPKSLAAAGFGGLRDPWGNPYQYTKLDDVKSKAKARKDKNLHPLNSDYDLCSVGPDGKTAIPLTAKASRDDIVRANNGTFVGLAADY